ncbi:hypothetical protein cyc_02190 [Cyclospora cayetanensis]|uniref:Molybdate-anion transporter n=1 Tax=Cyclospora cayetanensis TaxID=88456 RepID=A0A1D3D8X2_9EIME|nr:hypothetical protein cyc_02190 [Cyclospora cayetanensis]
MPPPASSPSAFAWRFVWIYFLAQLCEYLQGPFMFAAYRQYHSLPLERVGLLFFTSSLSNALSGCLLAPLGDAHDRRLGCVFFCLLSVAACALTRAALPFSWLILGRLLGGEEGLPTERHPRQAPKEGLTSPNLAFQETRLSATTEATTTARRETVEGLLLKAPQGSLPSPDRPLTAVSPPEAFQHALHLFASQSEVRLCGLLQVAFEAPLDLFVLLWTPGIPQQMNPGIAFAALMGGLATGSYLFCHVTRYFRMELYSVIAVAFLTGAASLLLSLASPTAAHRFLAYLAFEVVVGVLFPALGSLRSRLLPEACRASATNLPRVFLSFAFLGFLACKPTLHPSQMISLSAGIMAVGSLCAYSFGGTSSSEEAATNKAGRSTF